MAENHRQATPMVLELKVSSAQVNGLNWDLVGSNNAAPLFVSEEVLGAYIDFYVGAWLKFGNKESLRNFKYDSLLKAMNTVDKKSKWGVTNIFNNEYSEE